MGNAVGTFYPTLNLEPNPGLSGVLEAFRFFPSAWSAIELKRIAPKFTFHIHDVHGAAIGISSEDVQYPISDSEVSRLAPLIAALEDKRFFQHSGVDVKAILRAAVANIRSMRVVQGGGTITQQLVRNTLLSPAPSIVRKLMEIALALKLERHYTKDEIIRRYCELVYLGGGVRGFSAAARIVFRKRLGQTTHHELCALVGLLRKPSSTFPRHGNEDRFRTRGSLVGDFLERSFPRSVDLPNTKNSTFNPVKLIELKRERWTSLARRELSDKFGSASNEIVDVRTSIEKEVQFALDASGIATSMATYFRSGLHSR